MGRNDWRIPVALVIAGMIMMLPGFAQIPSIEEVEARLRAAEAAEAAEAARDEAERRRADAAKIEEQRRKAKARAAEERRLAEENARIELNRRRAEATQMAEDEKRRQAESEQAAQTAAEELAERRRIAENRYSRNRDGSVTDLFTGHQWSGADNGVPIVWTRARKYCEGKGRGWRVPDLDDLRGIWDSEGLSTQSCGDAACRIGSGIKLTGRYLWINETWSDGLGKGAFAFDASSGESFRPIGTVVRALCVRTSGRSSSKAAVSAFEAVHGGYLGIQVQQVSLPLANAFGLAHPHGALVASVVPDGPADKAGVQSGDIVVSFDGKRIESSGELPRLVGATLVGANVRIEFLRDRIMRELTVVIGKAEKP